MRILIIKIAALGDIAMCLPMIARLREKHPVCHITWIVGRSNRKFLEACAVADEIIEVNDSDLFLGSTMRRLASTFSVIWKLKFRHFNKAFNLHLDYRYWFFAALSRVDEKSEYRISPGRALSESFRFLAEEEKGPLLKEAPAFRLTRSVPRGTAVGIAPGGAKNIARDNELRRWPIESYRSLTELLIQQGHRIVILGAASDEWIRRYFSDLPVDLEIGTMNIEQFLDRLATLRLLITHDSGPLHFAHLVNTPVIAFFGPTSSANFFPRGNLGTAIQLPRPLPCQPCYDGRDYAQCFDNQCLKQITHESVFEKVQAYLASH